MCLSSLVLWFPRGRIMAFEGMKQYSRRSNSPRVGQREAHCGVESVRIRFSYNRHCQAYGKILLPILSGLFRAELLYTGGDIRNISVLQNCYKFLSNERAYRARDVYIILSRWFRWSPMVQSSSTRHTFSRYNTIMYLVNKLQILEEWVTEYFIQHQLQVSLQQQDGQGSGMVWYPGPRRQ